MDIDVECTDGFGSESYAKLFEDIMSDIGKAAQMEKAKILLDPHTPLFVFSVRLKAEPVNKTIGDVATVRSEGPDSHVTIADERYAPDILKQLYSTYGRSAVDQQTRFDMNVRNASEKDIVKMVISSGEEYMKEIVGSLWRTMPEGIKNRHTYIDGPVVTVVATEEIFQPGMLEEGLKIHEKMCGDA